MLHNPRYYPCVRDEEEARGDSTFWQLRGDQFWERIGTICPGAVHVVATMALDLPLFDRESIADCWATISYEIDETQYQTPMKLARLTVAETIDSTCMRFVNENEHSAILSLKSTSRTERIVNVRLVEANDVRDEYRSKKKQLFHFLATRAFNKVYGDVFLAKAHGSLMYCLVEVLSIDVDEARVRIYARSVTQLNVILHLLQDEFPEVTDAEEVDNCVEAAMALIRELEMIRDNKSDFEIQEAKLITDLLIS